MPKAMVKGDAYIRVEMSAHYSWAPSLEDIRKSILRHVDGVDASSVHIVDERKPVCSYCGRSWTEHSALYNGGCCDNDEENSPDN